jgi:hypothetical protein
VGLLGPSARPWTWRSPPEVGGLLQTPGIDLSCSTWPVFRLLPGLGQSLVAGSLRWVVSGRLGNVGLLLCCCPAPASYKLVTSSQPGCLRSCELLTQCGPGNT